MCLVLLAKRRIPTPNGVERVDTPSCIRIDSDLVNVEFHLAKVVEAART